MRGRSPVRRICRAPVPLDDGAATPLADLVGELVDISALVQPDAGYTVRLVDASGAPLSDVPLEISGPGVNAVVPTDGAGLVDVRDAAPGTATVRLADPAALAATLAEQKATAPGLIEPADDEVVATASRLLGGVPVESDEPVTIVLVTGVEIVFTPAIREGVELADENSLFAHEGGPVSSLQMHAVGDGARAILPELEADLLEPPPPADAPPPGPTVWEAPNIYHVQPGDYLVKIAATYLGDGARWPEIWALNKHRYPGRSPDELYVGDTLVMPPEAVPPFVNPPVQPQQGPSAPPGPAAAVDERRRPGLGPTPWPRRTSTPSSTGSDPCRANRRPCRRSTSASGRRRRSSPPM